MAERVSRSTFLPETGPFRRLKDVSMPTILVVDDDRNLLKIICDILESLEADIITASNAESALSAIKSQAFDLVITDLKMPGKSGMDVLAFSLNINASVPVIMVSAFGSIEAAVTQ